MEIVSDIGTQEMLNHKTGEEESLGTCQGRKARVMLAVVCLEEQTVAQAHESPPLHVPLSAIRPHPCLSKHHLEYQ